MKSPDETEAALRAEAEKQKAVQVSLTKFLEQQDETAHEPSDENTLAQIAKGAAQLRENKVLSLAEADAEFDLNYQAARRRVRIFPKR